MKMTLKAKLMNGQTRLLPEAMKSFNKMCDRVSEKAFFAKGVQQRQGRQEQDAETNRSDLFRWEILPESRDRAAVQTRRISWHR